MGNWLSFGMKKEKSKEKYKSPVDDGNKITENGSQDVDVTEDRNKNAYSTDESEKPELKDDKPPQIEKQTTPKVEPKKEKIDEPESQKSKVKKKKPDESESSDYSSSSSSSSVGVYSRYSEGKTVVTNIKNVKNVAIGSDAKFIDNRVYVNQNGDRDKKRNKDTKKKETRRTNKGKDKQDNRDNFLKSPNEIKDIEARHFDVLSEATQSVGMIQADDHEYGTGFRVGSKYVMTAYHIVRKIIDPQKTGNFCEKRLADAKRVWIVFNFKSLGEVLDDNFKALRFNFEPKLIYSNEDLDTAVLALREESGKEFPKPIKNFAELEESKSTYLLGHPDGKTMISDPDIRLIKADKDLFEEAKKWSLKYYKMDGYEGISDERKVLFHTSFQHGGSGSPGVMLTSENKVTVVLMLLKGFPSFYYNDFNASKKEAFRNERGHNFLLEQGISMKSVWSSMKDIGDYAELCEEIFSDQCFNA